MAIPNPFSAIDHVEFDFELPALPHGLERIDHWYNRLTDLQRVGVALLSMLFLAASAFYCLGLGSTVLVNRAEAIIAADDARATPVPTLLPTTSAVVEAPVLSPVVVTATPIARATTAPSAPTAVGLLPTPIPAQLLPTVPISAPQQRPSAPVDTAPVVPVRPRIVAPYEAPTPTSPAVPARPAPAAPAGTTNTTVRAGTPTPAFSAPGILRTPPAAVVTPARPAGTSAPAPAARPTTGPGQSTQPTPASKPTTAPIFTNPFPATAVPKPGATPAAKPSGVR